MRGSPSVICPHKDERTSSEYQLCFPKGRGEGGRSIDPLNTCSHLVLCDTCMLLITCTLPMTSPYPSLSKHSREGKRKRRKNAGAKMHIQTRHPIQFSQKRPFPYPFPPLFLFFFPRWNGTLSLSPSLGAPWSLNSSISSKNPHQHPSSGARRRRRKVGGEESLFLPPFRPSCELLFFIPLSLFLPAIMSYRGEQSPSLPPLPPPQ